MSAHVIAALRIVGMLVVALIVAGCPVSLVQPYDEKLLNDTEALFKKASAMIDDGIASSPRTDDERAGISKPPVHPAHESKFEGRYNSLATDADALILRAISKSKDVDPIGEKLQQKINDLIEGALPIQCEELEGELAAAKSLTVKNYVDLRCLLVRWKAQHSDSGLTRDTGILKRTNWELRKAAIFSAVLAINRAEMSKAQ